MGGTIDAVWVIARHHATPPPLTPLVGGRWCQTMGRCLPVPQTHCPVPFPSLYHCSHTHCYTYTSSYTFTHPCAPQRIPFLVAPAGAAGRHTHCCAAQIGREGWVILGSQLEFLPPLHCIHWYWRCALELLLQGKIDPIAIGGHAVPSVDVPRHCAILSRRWVAHAQIPTPSHPIHSPWLIPSWVGVPVPSASWVPGGCVWVPSTLHTRTCHTHTWHTAHTPPCPYRGWLHMPACHSGLQFSCIPQWDRPSTVGLPLVQLLPS